MTVSFFRAFYAVPVLLVLHVLSRNKVSRTRRQRVLSIVAGLILAGNHAAWHVAIELMGAGLATVVGSTHVVIMMVVAWLLLGERPTGLGLGAAPVVMLGVVLISGVVGTPPTGQSPLRGVLFGILMASCYVAFLLLLRHAGSGGVSSVATLLDATLGAAVGGLILAPLDSRFSLIPTWPGHGWLLVLALGVQVVGWLVIARNLPWVEAWRSSMLLVLEPAATVLWAYMIFAETFSMAQSFGLLLVIGGVATIALSRQRLQTGREPVVDRS